MDARILHQALLDPKTYPEKTTRVDFRETHVSRLYFTDRHVYKVKKPVDFGFLNFTTLDRRRFFCNEEVRLNNRYCPGVYLEVVEIRRRGNRLVIGPEGEIVDYAVRMRRLPEDRMLDRLLESTAPLPSGLPERLARKIAGMHRASEICRKQEEGPNLETVRANWRENLSQMVPFLGKTLSQKALDICSGYVDGFLKRNAPLLVRRQEEGFVREGHGDLHAENICLTEPICIYDCIEFNRRFRVADIAADLAFLLMDLDFRGRRDLSAAILSAYRKEMGEDPDLGLVLPFYKIYRAFVRGKVDSFLSEDNEAGQAVRQEAAGMARSYFNLGLGYLCPPALVLTCGLMGTGKTTVARGLAEAVGATLLRSDRLRKELAGLDETSRQEDPYGQGTYSPEFTRRTYQRLLERTTAELSERKTVVADASFIRLGDRERFRAAAEKLELPFFVVLTECDEETALARLDNRRRAGSDASDGRRELFSLQAADFETPAENGNLIRVDTAKSVDYNVQLILCELIERTGPCP
jgi:aminoglycoside phosphotransferase family enzyme/predicted kinase